MDTIIICGPTASGKTGLAIDIAHQLELSFNCKAEIINADSVQMYHDLKILTAYPSQEELSQVPHNLFGILEAHESSSVASWLDLADCEIKRIHSEGKIAIICGGTGFYINALLNGVVNIPTVPQDFREKVKKYFDEIGRDAFFEKLSQIDSISAQKLHKNDTQRILRAYEVAAFTGKTLFEWKNGETSNDAPVSDGIPNNGNNNDNHNSSSTDHQNTSKIPTIVLLPEREKLRSRAHLRLLKMIDQGAIDEVREFIAKYPHYDGALREVIGYREIAAFLESYSTQNSQSTDQLIEKIRIRTNQYIKRQSTWFRNQLKSAKFILDFGNNSITEAMNFVTQTITNHAK